MLYLLNSIPRKQHEWKLLENVMGAGDSIVLYENAATLVTSENAVPRLLAWLHQGLRLYVLTDQPDKDFHMSKPLVDKVIVVSWESLVDLITNSQGVCSL